ncbi:MAG: ferrous iron transport protein B [Deltaproteobacteria bacterium]|nr:ferrous iron transport protein B [Deltaproteobacteria bacterium]
MSLSLDQLPREQRARVTTVGGDGAWRRRILEMGLLPGVEVRVVHVAPLGDPITISVRDARLTLRKEDAALVGVVIDLERPTPTPEPMGGRVAFQLPGADATEEVERAQFRVAVVGNPNTGKSTLFNHLTGERAQVGNYPGITVERAVGWCQLYDRARIELVDVPGCYSLYARSAEEQVAIDELLGRREDGPWSPPDAVLVVLDATRMERSMYLLLQVQELGLPAVAVVNMMDEAHKQGVKIDIEALAEHVGIPAVGVVAKEGKGLDRLSLLLHQVLRAPPLADASGWHWSPGPDLEAHLDGLTPSVRALAGPLATNRARAVALWCLMSLQPGDDLRGISPALRERVLAMREDMIGHGHDLDMEVTQARYAHIDMDRRHYLWHTRRSVPFSDRVDAVLTHPVWGLVAFLGVMAVVFSSLFDLAAPMMDGLEAAVGWVRAVIASALPEHFLTSLLVDGVLGGVGAVVVFLPQILILFALITLLEGSGYMARAAMVSDRIMGRLGLQGQAFVPMISGFACTVPAILATRTMDRRRERLLTIMVLPLISCSARLPVYTLVIAALFPATERVLGPLSLGTLMMFAIYGISTLLTLAVAGVLGRVALPGKPSPMLLELPPYRLPSLGLMGRVMWERSLDFLKTAGTVIVVASTVLWLMFTFPAPPVLEPAQAPLTEQQEHARAIEYSAAGQLGHAMEPIIAPLGFDWRIGVGLVGSMAAREVFVATMGLVYGVGEDGDSLREVMRDARKPDGSRLYTPLTGVSLMVYFLIALQCVSTIAVTLRETRSWRWTAFQFGYIQALAYLASLLVFQLGTLLGF